MAEKHSGQSGAEKSRRYIDPEYRKRKKKEREDLQSRFDALAGPVEVRKVEDNGQSEQGST